MLSSGAIRGLRRLAGQCPFLWYGALALVISAPLMRGGYLLLLDFALVRHVPIQWQPTAAVPGPVNTAPVGVVLWLLARLEAAAAPLLVLGIFLLMGLAAHQAVLRLVSPDHRVAAFFAGTVYALNPFTYERLMQGHLFLLAAYGLAPFVLVAANRLLEQPQARSALMLGALITVIASTSIHYLAMLPLVLIPFFVLRSETWSRDVLRWGAVALVVVIVANLWWIVGVFRVQPGELVTTRDVEAYATQPESPAVIGNVAALYGFWRHEFRLPKDGVAYWWLLLLPIAGLVVDGGVSSVKDPRLRRLGIALLVIIPVAIVLASGTSFSPTRGLFRGAFDNVPGFKLFREPQKWVAVLPLCYAILGAIGLDRLLQPTKTRNETKRERRLIASVGVVAVLIPCAYAWTLLWNWDRLRPVRFPSDWAAAEQTMRDGGGGRLLFLPWHLYMTMSFTGHRVVNPAPSYFTGPVISGDNVELGNIRSQSQNPVSRRIEAVIFNSDEQANLEPTLRDLCVRWVALAKETDHESYRWLFELEGLQTALDGPTITLFRMERSPQQCKN